MKDKALKEALFRIGGYVIVMSAYESVGESRFGTLGRFLLAGAVFLLLMLDAPGIKTQFCAQSLKTLPYRKLLYLLPMIGLSTVNLWCGPVMQYSPLDTVWYVGAMLFIGIVEELIFRGYLLHAMEKQSVRTAVSVSSLTFGLGHIVNLVSGKALYDTLLQLVYAFAIGLMLSVFMVRVKNIIPCCAFHGVFNALSAFTNEAGMTDMYELGICIIISVVSVLYALYLWKRDDCYEPEGVKPAQPGEFIRSQAES